MAAAPEHAQRCLLEAEQQQREHGAKDDDGGRLVSIGLGLGLGLG